MHKSLSVLAAAVLLASVSAHAQHAGNNGVRYKWVDGKGMPHFSDSLSAEAMKYGYDLVNDQGMVVGHVSRQLNATERAAAQQQVEQQAAQQRAAQDQARAESQMMSAYPDEASYRLSLQQVLAGIDQQIHTSKLNLRSQEQALTDLLARAADAERTRKPVSKFLQDSIAKQRGVVTDLRNVLLRQQAHREQTVQLQVQQLARYRALKAAQAQPAQ